jgi:hypothetical protein
MMDKKKTTDKAKIEAKTRTTDKSKIKEKTPTADTTKYGKYFFYGFGEAKKKKSWGRVVSVKDETPLLRLDATRLKGINCCSVCNWFWPSLVKEKLEKRSTKPHSHDYDEIVGMVGTNPDDPNDLCGEIEITIDGEKHLVTQSCLVFLPAGLEHGPFRELKMERPIFQFEFGLKGIHD